MSITTHPVIPGIGFHRGTGILCITGAKKGDILMIQTSELHVPQSIEHIWGVHWYVIQAWAFQPGTNLTLINAPSITDLTGTLEAVNCSFHKKVIIPKKESTLTIKAIKDILPNTFLIIDYGRSCTLVSASFHNFSTQRLAIYTANLAHCNDLNQNQMGCNFQSVCERCGNLVHYRRKRTLSSGKQAAYRRTYNPNSQHNRSFCIKGLRFPGTTCEDAALKYLPQGFETHLPPSAYKKFNETMKESKNNT